MEIAGVEITDVDKKGAEPPADTTHAWVEDDGKSVRRWLVLCDDGEYRAWQGGIQAVISKELLERRGSVVEIPAKTQPE